MSTSSLAFRVLFLAPVRHIQRLVKVRARIRIDANLGIQRVKAFVSPANLSQLTSSAWNGYVTETTGRRRWHKEQPCRSWRVKAGVAASRIINAGEMYGFLKPCQKLFADQLVKSNGAMVVHAFRPWIDAEVLASCTHTRLEFGTA